LVGRQDNKEGGGKRTKEAVEAKMETQTKTSQETKTKTRIPKMNNKKKR